MAGVEAETHASCHPVLEAAVKALAFSRILTLPSHVLLTHSKNASELRDFMAAAVNSSDGHGTLVLVRPSEASSSLASAFQVTGCGGSWFRGLTVAEVKSTLDAGHAAWHKDISQPFAVDNHATGVVRVLPIQFPLDALHVVLVLDLMRLTPDLVVMPSPEYSEAQVKKSQHKAAAHRQPMPWPVALCALSGGTYEPTSTVVTSSGVTTERLSDYRGAHESAVLENKGFTWFFNDNKTEAMEVIRQRVAEYAHILLNTKRATELVLGVQDAASSCTSELPYAQPLIFFKKVGEHGQAFADWIAQEVRNALHVDTFEGRRDDAPAVYPCVPGSLQVHVTILSVEEADLVTTALEGGGGQRMILARCFASRAELHDFAVKYNLAKGAPQVVPLILDPPFEDDAKQVVGLLEAGRHLHVDGFVPLPVDTCVSMPVHAVVRIKFPASERVHFRPASVRIVESQPPAKVSEMPWPLACMSVRPASLTRLLQPDAMHVLLTTDAPHPALLPPSHWVARLREAHVWEYELNVGRILTVDVARVHTAARVSGSVHILVAVHDEHACDVNALDSALHQLTLSADDKLRIFVTVVGVSGAALVSRITGLFVVAPEGGAWLHRLHCRAPARINLEFASNVSALSLDDSAGARRAAAAAGGGRTGDQRALSLRYLRGDTANLMTPGWRWKLMMLPTRVRVDVHRAGIYMKLMELLQRWYYEKRLKAITVSRQHPAAGARTAVARAVYDFIQEVDEKLARGTEHARLVCPWLGTGFAVEVDSAATGVGSSAYAGAGAGAGAVNAAVASYSLPPTERYVHVQDCDERSVTPPVVAHGPNDLVITFKHARTLPMCALTVT
ncbi:MAG: hypothetical protein EOO65_00225 [Methanosarcinales archaeon]|nr:MAG: hypothetical protein EOO65_00225 [Methanosarcinales archaeon]